MNTRRLKTAFRVFCEQGPAGVAKILLRKMADRDLVALPGPDDGVWTEYMTWLTIANAGMLTHGNVRCLDHAIRNIPSASPIVEIGSFCGLSANMITYLKERHGVGNPLVTCDKWLFEGARDGEPLGDSKTVTHREYREFVRDMFLRNARMFSRLDLPVAIEDLSDEFFGAWARGEKRTDVFGRRFRLGGPISFCYIDGNHTYEYARRDFENCDRYLERGGFVLFDDSDDASARGAWKVAREVAGTGRYELVAKNPNYFFRKK
jgi:hypothetical protein